MKRIFAILILAVMMLTAGQTSSAQQLPSNIASGPFKSGHIQGIAYDRKNQHLYLSYTTMLVKTDLQGNILGSVVGLVGHLGDLSFNEKDGRVYGSLEYKDDSIGKSIMLGEKSTTQIPNAFYIAIFDCEKIDREGILPSEEGMVTTVHLGRVLEDYSASVTTPEGKFRHRLGCSGIDGVSFGPKFGKRGGKQYLTVAYGVYSDLKRNDNNYQVLHQYDVSDWKRYERPLAQASDMHQEGPASPDREYYTYTGNTNYGVQNLEYDKEQKVWWMAVYPGRKPAYPNYSLFAIDGRIKPATKPLEGIPYIAEGNVLTLQRRIPCLVDEASGTSGWNFGAGSTGFQPIGKGFYYISFNYATEEGEGSNLRLHRLNGNENGPFEWVR